jgi:polysaccharide biosynthesis protein PslG
MRRRVLWLLAGLAVAATLTACRSASSPALGVRAGFAEGSTLLSRTEGELDAELDGIAATGARWLRVDVDWDVLEHERGVFDWRRVDRVVLGARRRGLQVLGLLTYTPPWARPAATSNKHPPTHVADFAAFAAAAGLRYAHRGIVAWEIWNEPNLSGFWEPAADPERYARLLRVAAAALRAVAPGTTIVSGGLAPSETADGSMAPATFLARLYRAGAGPSFDAVGHHPYNYPGSPLDPTGDFNHNAFGGVTLKLRELMLAHGDGDKLIWGTETGAPSVGPRAPPSLAAHVAQSYVAWSSWDFTGPLFWYSFRDAGDSPDPEDHFGLTTSRLDPKGSALRRYTEIARGG